MSSTDELSQVSQQQPPPPLTHTLLQTLSIYSASPSGERISSHSHSQALATDHPVLSKITMAANQNQTLWACHMCHSGPHTIANTTRCVNTTSCNHDMCRLCPRDSDIPPEWYQPAPTATPWPPTSNLAPNGRSRVRSTVPGAAPLLYSRPILNGSYAFLLHSRPCTRGWWTCSECSNMNNPKLAPSRCSICSHYKCRSCIRH